MLFPLVFALVVPKAEPAASPAALEAHVKFLASDELAGRASPSPGLDAAAAYIARQFKEAKLEDPAKGYFQETTFKSRSAEGTVRNVIGLLPGSDPKLKNEYIIISAHYDHLGKRSQGEGDVIYNGANDDASGVAGVLEMARLFGQGKAPRRSLVFMTFWGEERGLLGSAYYVKNPVFPLKSTDAMIELEQIGRTDDSEGARVGAFNLTGFQLSNLADFLKEGAAKSGIKFEGHPRLSIPYFGASDNYPFAVSGVVAHTVSVAYEYPDYHGLADDYTKLDYANMSKIVKAVADGVRLVANADKPLRYSETEPAAKRYREAAATLHGD